MPRCREGVGQSSFAGRLTPVGGSGLAEDEIRQVGVAAGPPHHVLGPARNGSWTASGQDQLLHGPYVHPPYRELGHRRHPQRIGQPAVEAVALVEVGVPIGREDGQALAIGEPGDQVGQRVQGARVGPLQVVDHQDGWPVCLQLVHGGPDLEQRETVGRAGQGWDEVVEPAVRSKPVAGIAVGAPQPVGESLGERDVAGDLGAEAQALTEQDVAAALACRAGRLAHQARLADPGLAAQQEHAGLAGDRALDDDPQRLALGFATDQDGLGPHPMIIRHAAHPVDAKRVRDCLPALSGPTGPDRPSDTVASMSDAPQLSGLVLIGFGPAATGAGRFGHRDGDQSVAIYRKA